jgi:ankyrin repeat protein
MLTLLLAQNGDTALMLACANEQEAAAGELMEATKRAGALDLQGGQYKRSALHLASAKGLAGTVAQLLALGADATLKDKVYRYPHVLICRLMYVCVCVCLCVCVCVCVCV